MKGASGITLAVTLLGALAAGLLFTSETQTNINYTYNFNETTINFSLIPAQDNTFDLGNSTNMWRYVYIGTAIYSPILYDINDVSYYLNPSGISVLNILRASNIYNKTEVGTLLANLNESLKSWTQTNYYNKTETDNLLINLNNSIKIWTEENFINNTELENTLSDYYNKTETDNLLYNLNDSIRSWVDDNFVNNSELQIDQQIQNDSLKSWVSQNYYNKSETDTLLNNLNESLKIYISENYYNKTEVYNKSETDALLTNLNDSVKSWVQTNYYNKSTIDSWNLIKNYILEQSLNANGFGISGVSSLGMSGDVVFNVPNATIHATQGLNIHLDKDYNGTFALNIQKSNGTTVASIDELGKFYGYDFVDNRYSVSIKSPAVVVYVAASDSPAEYKAHAKYVCDGTDDQVEINNAINDVSAAGGGVVYLAPGHYYLSAPIYLKKWVYVKGAGPGNTILINQAIPEETMSSVMIANHPSQWTATGYNGGNRMGVMDMTLDLNYRIALGIGFIHAHEILIKNVEFMHIKKWHAIELNAVKYAIITQCKFRDAYYYYDFEEMIQIDIPVAGSWLAGDKTYYYADGTPCREIIIANNHFWSFMTGISSHRTGTYKHESVIIVGNTFEGGHQFGIRVQNAAGWIISKNTFRNFCPNDVSTGDPAAIFVNDWSRNVLIKGNVITNFNCNNGIYGNRGIYLSGNSSDLTDLYHVVIDDNLIDNVARYCIAVDYAGFVTITGNFVRGCGKWATKPGDAISVYLSERVLINGNQVDYILNGRHGVHVWNGAKRVFISGNVITNAGGYAVKEDTGCDYTIVRNNVLQGSSGMVSLVGANSVSVDNSGW